jgi:hypothetical protein
MNDIQTEPQALPCQYLRHIDILKAYEQLEDYNPYSSDSLGLSNIPEQFRDTLATCLLDIAEFIERVTSERWQGTQPIELAAMAGDIIEHVIEQLHNSAGQEWPSADDTVEKMVEKLAALPLTDTYVSAAPFELTALVIYQYDCLCWLWDNNYIPEAFEVFELIAGTRGQIQHIAALGFQEHRDAAAATQRAQELARKRHAATNKLKDQLLAEWVNTRTEYKSRADFCRIVGRRSGVLERTLSGWIANHGRD